MSTTLAKPRIRSAPAKSPLLTLREDMNELMARFWEGEQNELFASTFSPAADLSETDKQFELRMDLPGMQANEIDVQVHGNTVTLSGARKEEKSEKGKMFHRLERHSGVFARTITLPCHVKEQEVTAEYAGGVLTVTLPKCEQRRAHRVEVKG